MSNLFFCYRNHCIDSTTITEVYGTSNSDYGTSKLVDNNLQSYFLANGITSKPSILFNFGTQVYVDSLIVIHNLNETGTLYIKAGDTIPPITEVYGLPILGSTGTSMNYFTPEVPYTYWQLFTDGTNMNTPVKINEVFIGKRDVFPVNPEYSFSKEMDSSTIITESEKGQRKIYHKYTKQKWNFSYPSIDVTLEGTFNKIRNYCGGSYKPFFMCLDKDDNKFETYFTRFIKNSYKHTEIAYNTFDISFSLEEEL